jgi:hypothetical protein
MAAHRQSHARSTGDLGTSMCLYCSDMTSPSVSIVWPVAIVFLDTGAATSCCDTMGPLKGHMHLSVCATELDTTSQPCNLMPGPVHSTGSITPIRLENCCGARSSCCTPRSEQELLRLTAARLECQLLRPRPGQAEVLPASHKTGTAAPAARACSVLEPLRRAVIPDSSELELLRCAVAQLVQDGLHGVVHGRGAAAQHHHIVRNSRQPLLDHHLVHKANAACGAGGAAQRVRARVMSGLRAAPAHGVLVQQEQY